MIFIHAPDEIKEYAYRVADHLGLDRYGFTDIFMEYEDLGAGIDGAIYGDNESACIEINPAQTMEQLLKTVAHEMVHAYQLFRGDLTYKGADMYWRGECMTAVPYLDQGHEIEAIAAEDSIYNACK